MIKSQLHPEYLRLVSSFLVFIDAKHFQFDKSDIWLGGFKNYFCIFPVGTITGLIVCMVMIHDAIVTSPTVSRVCVSSVVL